MLFGQYKQDCEGAEEYYSRAILADPDDGEVLSQYGKLVWELHHNQERASSYFERAVQASPEDRCAACPVFDDIQFMLCSIKGFSSVC